MMMLIPLCFQIGWNFSNLLFKTIIVMVCLYENSLHDLHAKCLFLYIRNPRWPPQQNILLYPHSTGGGYTVLPLSALRPSVQDIFGRIFLSNNWWQKSDIWSQASYSYAILWEAFLDPSDSYFLFADLVGFYTHWTYMRGYQFILFV